MLNERLRDIQEFETHQEKVKVYGMHFQERLQAKNPQRRLVGRMAPRCYLMDEGMTLPSTLYVVGEEVDVPRKGLGRLLFGESEKKLRVLVQLERNYYFGCRAVIHDASLIDSAEEIIAEQDEESLEKYSSNIRHSTKEYFFKFKPVEIPLIKAGDYE